MYNLKNYILYRKGLILCKINKNNGTVINACPDPVCKHNEACLYNRYYISVNTYENTLYMADILPYENSAQVIISINIENNTLEQYYKNSGNEISKIAVNDKYIFFCQRNGENYSNIYRINKKNKEILQFTPENRENYYILLFVSGDYIYYLKDYYLYRADVNFENAVKLKDEPMAEYEMQTDGERIFYKKIYYSDKSDTMAWQHDLYSMNMDGSDDKLICKNIITFRLTDKHIYFSYWVKNDTADTFYVYDMIKGKIYCMNKDGSDINLVFDNPDLFIASYDVVSGDYIYCNLVDRKYYNDTLDAKLLPDPYRIKIGSDEPAEEIIYDEES
jgi:hypothetical protein